MTPSRHISRLPAGYLRIWGLFAVLVLGHGALAAGPAAAAPVAVEDLVRRALEQHPDLAAAAAGADAQEARRHALESGNWPQVGYNAGLSQTTSVSPSQLSATPFALSSAGLNVRQRLLDFGRTDAELNQAQAGAEAARQQAAVRAVEVAFGVRRAYLEWVRSRSNSQLAARRVEDARDVRDQAEAFLKAGRRPRIDVTRAVAALEQAAAALARARHAEQAAALAVGAAIGQPGPIDGDPVLPAAHAFAQEAVEEAEKAAREDHPRLRAAEERLRAAQWSLAGAERASWPELRADLNYGLRIRDVTPGQNWSAGVTLTGPIFDGFAGQRAVDQAKAGHRAEQAGVLAERLAVTAAVRQAALAASAARARIPASEAAVSAAQENLSFATGRYQAGVGSIIEVGDAQTLLASAEADLLATRIDYHLAIADLLRAVGRTGL